MPPITLDQISACYSAARAVEAGERNQPAAARELNLSCGMSIGSAKNYLQVLRSLRSGTVYKRMLSVEAYRYYLNAILVDYRSDGLQIALQSVRRHIHYLEERGEGAVPALRRALEEFDIEDRRVTLESMAEQLHTAVRSSLADLRTERLARLQQAPIVPQKVDVRVSQYVRNADVIAEVLLRASGHCEYCKSPAPFRRASDGSPYLEVHHVIQLASGGEDTIANAVALCPNCHRRAHFGATDS